MNLNVFEHLKNYPWVPVFLILAILLAEVAALSQLVDAYSLVQRGFQGWQGLFGYLGSVAKWVVALLVSLLLLLAPQRATWRARLAEHLSFKRAGVWLGFQFGAFLWLVIINARVFGENSQPSNGDFLLWGLASLLVLLSTAMALMPGRLWRIFAYENYVQILLAILVATGVLALALSSGKLWGPLASGTFQLAEFWLHFIPLPDLYVDEAERTLGINGFYVHVADACSGYEGIGLVSAFTALFFYLYRHLLKFPMALLLWPLGVVAIWLLNSVRIALLILIGALWSPEVAVGGFHSQAGWLMFIATSLIVLWLALKLPIFMKTDEQAPSPLQDRESGQDGFAVLIPLICLLGATLITGALSADFDLAYPLRVVAVAAALWWVWPTLGWQISLPSRPHAYAVGLVVAVLWVGMLGIASPTNTEFETALFGLPNGWAYVWLAMRFVGAVITVPIAEELAFRGYLLARLSRSENYTCGPLPRAVIALLISSVAFGALHGAWFAGTVAGLMYGYLRWQSNSINEAIWAHALTNGLLCVLALMTGAWHLL